ncbi:hypothetical protein F4775DRAFT_593140 [Biscogniauxia sp. FL1348]|nr:hypothetical protein F4775DRAFT_593140 [Biscogniauxia sp. FL1348]
MAPPSTTAAIIFDYRSQVLDNCEFFVGRDDIISVITVKDGVGNYKAYAIRSNEDSREALLSSESFDTIHKAIESLHTKSSEAVYQYIKTNGFSNPPDLKKAGLCSDEDDDTISEVTRRSSSSTAAPSEEEWNSSDDEAMMSGNTARNRHGDHKVSIHSFNRKDRKPMAADKPRRSRSSTRRGQDESDEESPLMPGGFGYFGPMRSSPTAYRPPPPPPGWSGAPSTVVRNVPAVPYFQQPLPQPHPHHPRPPPPPSFANTPRYPQVGVGPGSARVPCPVPAPAPHLPMPTPPTTTTNTSSSSTSTSPTSSTSSVTATATTAASSPVPFPLSSAQRLYDVRLTIRWLHHGEQRIIENLRPSLRALQEAALRYVRTHPQSFQSTSSNNMTAMTSTSINCLRSCVRQAFFGSESYDMSTYRSDDLSRLFAALSSGGIPRFEIDVDFIGSTGMAQNGGRDEK